MPCRVIPNSVNGVILVATTHSATAAANTQTMRLMTFSGTPQVVTAWSLVSFPITTITVPTAIMPNAPLGGAWTKTGVDNAIINWGMSNDATPNPILDGVCLEVDYVQSVPLAATLTPITFTLTAIALARSTADNVATSVSPATFTLTLIALARSVGTVAQTLGVAIFTLTTIALTRSVGAVTTSFLQLYLR
jgi:hypothetical protein